MTIRGNRQAAAGIAVAGAGLSAFMCVIALVIGIPQLLLGVALMVVTFVLVAAFLLLPVSMSIEGDQFVYRSGRKERRYPRSDVASCTLAPSAGRGAWSWVFSNQAGSRLFAVNGLRFQDADLAAFCARAGIAWKGPSVRPVDRLGRDIRSAKFLLRLGAAAGAIFLVLMGLAAWTQTMVRDDLARYRAAPECTSSEAGASGCRLQTQARITSVNSNQYYATLHLTLVPGGGEYSTSLALPGPKVGDVVAVELWGGMITQIAGRDTTKNPAENPNLNISGVIAGLGLFALGCFGLAARGWSRLSTARARLRAAEGPA